MIKGLKYTPYVNCNGVSPHHIIFLELQLRVGVATHSIYCMGEIWLEFIALKK